MTMAAIPSRFKRRSTHIALFMLILLSFYVYAFFLTGRAGDLDHFDSILTQDMAQIARNTLHGHFLETKYITPVGYAFFERVEDHPDYIRYPLPIMMYTVLFAVFPASPVTIKLFSAFLFLLNGYLLARMFSLLLPGNDRSEKGPPEITMVAWTAALLSSILILPYLQIALSDACEVPATTLFLLVAYALVAGRHPLLIGLLCSLLYLSRPNMGLLMPFAACYLVGRSKGVKGIFATLGLFALGVITVFFPFIIRNLHYTGKPVFSIQQYVEFSSHSIPSHYALYRSFSIPGTIFEYLPKIPPYLKSKYLQNVELGFSFALNGSYLPALLGLPFCIWLIKKARKLVVIILLFVLFHVLVISLFIQLFRIYIPMYFLLTSLGYLGLITAVIQMTRALKSRLARKPLSILCVVLAIIMCGSVITTRRSDIGVAMDFQAQLISKQALKAIKNNDIRCMYSNSPFWIPWYADIICIYAPLNIYDIPSKGPAGCRHYLFIDDPARTLKQQDVRFLRQHGTVIEEGENFALYRLNLD